MTPIAYVDSRRHIVVIGRDGKHRPQSADGVVWGQWTSARSEASTWSWPTWSPDGRRLACFRIAAEPPSAWVHVLDVDGIGASDLVDLGSRLPIYLHWSPAGDRIAVLAQKEDHLLLTAVRPDELGREQVLASGSPLFFTWADNRVAAFVGQDQPSMSRMSVHDPRDGQPTIVLPGTPTSFCAPIWLPETQRLLYVVQREGRASLVSGRVGDPEPVVLESVDGLVALVASPDGRHVARAIAPDGDGAPYRDLAVLDVATGEIRAVAEQPCLAFAWAGDALLLARVDTERNRLIWSLLAMDGRIERLFAMSPTRDFVFWLRFFEQYAQSHRIVDHTGEHVLVCGSLDGPAESPRLWRIRLADGSSEELGEGVFATWSTSP
jgi:dipeptidyl aminopeptidase/acylaminoacyl peptidase